MTTPSRPPRRVRAAVAATAAAAVMAAAVPAPAWGAAAEDAGVRDATARVESLLGQVQERDAALGAALTASADAETAVARAVSARVEAETARTHAVRDARARRADLGARVRSLYTSGGTWPLVAASLREGSPAEVLHRLSVAERVVGVDAVGTDDAAHAAADAADVADGARATAEEAQRAVRAASEVVTATEQLLAQQRSALAEAQAEVERLRREAEQRRAAEAEAARRAAEEAARRAAEAADALRAREQQVAVVASDHAAGILSDLGDIPAHMLELYRSAAETCPGLPWSVLAGVGRVETRHGLALGVSSAGARGPMQFMPATWRSVAVDGDGDGDRDIDDPVDAVFSAAHYLCISGARGGGEAGLRRALFAYNHANWYVDLVLRLAADYAALEP